MPLYMFTHATLVAMLADVQEYANAAREAGTTCPAAEAMVVAIMTEIE